MRRFPLLLLACATPASFAAGQSKPRFPDATETVPELIALWEESNSACRAANGGDVKVAAACLSRAVYGVALNERDWCYGRENQANAEMEWHECGQGSLRLPPFDVPEF